MRMKNSISMVLALAMMMPAGAQQAPQTASTGTPTFKANANLVILDVTAKDKGGLTVEGLKADDFTVLEDGKPQKLSVFEFQKHSSSPEPPKDVKQEDQSGLTPQAQADRTSAMPRDS